LRKWNNIPHFPEIVNSDDFQTVIFPQSILGTVQVLTFN